MFPYLPLLPKYVAVCFLVFILFTRKIFRDVVVVIFASNRVLSCCCCILSGNTPTTLLLCFYLTTRPIFSYTNVNPCVENYAMFERVEINWYTCSNLACYIKLIKHVLLIWFVKWIESESGLCFPFCVIQTQGKTGKLDGSGLNSSRYYRFVRGQALHPKNISSYVTVLAHLWRR